jgi:NADPH:quinone reductase-like Zn-dependent oxidoreductase
LIAGKLLGLPSQVFRVQLKLLRHKGMSRRYTLEEHAGAYRLTPGSFEVGDPDDRHVKIRVRATSLNYRDLIALKNLAGRKVAGVVPLSDGAGEVIAVGPGVERFKIGDRVAACFFQSWIGGRFDMAYHKSDLGGSLDGMLAEEVILHEDGLVRAPEYLSFEETACLPCAAVTAWNGLVTRGGLRTGDTVLAQGTGGVSVFAVQIAKAYDARVLVTSSSDQKLARACELGAVEGINYATTPDWDKEVWRLTGNRGVDHVVEVGGPGTLEKSLKCVAAGGHIAQIGVLTGFQPANVSLFTAVAKNARIDGIYVGSREDFEVMNDLFTQHQIRPVIDRTFTFEEAEAAFRYMESGAHFGKVVIQV